MSQIPSLPEVFVSCIAERQLANKQDDLDMQQAKQRQQLSQLTSMNSAADTLQRQLDDASTAQVASQEQLTSALSKMSEYKQQITDLQVAQASSKAAQESSSQSILALHASAARQASALTASEAGNQTLLAELDVKDEQLKQVTAKLRAAEYAAATSQDAASRLKARLSGQQLEATDDRQALTEALETGSATVHELQLSIQTLQNKVFAAEHAIESQHEQLSSQQTAASHASQQLEQLSQQLSAKDSVITSIQSAAVTANFVAESNQQLVSSLQDSINSQQEDASRQVNCLMAQLRLQADKNDALLTELSSTRGKLLAADEAIAAGQDKLLGAEQEQSCLAGRVAFLSQLLERREQRDWLATLNTKHLDVQVHL